MDNSFYTYAYLREDGTPYYIGKGKDDRAYDIFNRKAKTPPRERILILKKNLTEEEAFRHEVYMIAVFGRKQFGEGGILWNFTDGGEGISGAVLSPETRGKMSESRKGRVFSEETRRKIGEKSKGRNIGRKHFRTEETRKKLSDAKKGKPSPMLGKKHSEETKRKISESAKRRRKSQ